MPLDPCRDLDSEPFAELLASRLTRSIAMFIRDTFTGDGGDGFADDDPEVLAIVREEIGLALLDQAIPAGLREVAIPTKLLPPAELQATGLLQEVNRLFFHPRGLALTIELGGKGGDRIVGIQDARDDPEGFAFDSLEEPEASAKERNVAAMLSEKAGARLSRFGSVIQPVGPQFPSVESDNTEGSLP